MNLEKRIKRHIIGPRHDFFAVTLPGFEGLCADELRPLSDTLDITETFTGGVLFQGRLTDLYLANLHVRTAGRILMRLSQFKSSNFNKLESRIGAIPWELYLPPGAVPDLQVATHHSRLYHSGAVAEHVRQSIATYWSDKNTPSVPSQDQTLFIRLQDDGATLSLDGSGAPLHRRGLKTHRAKAPVRETMAAAILLLAGYRHGLPLVDPMCGSGTFSLEAALMAKQIPSGHYRKFAFMGWPAFRPQQWAHMKKITGQKILTSDKPLIWASDTDGSAVNRLEACLEQNNLGDAARASQGDFFSLGPEALPTSKGLVVLNPPYGKRVSAKGQTEKQYLEIASKLKKDFKGWRMAMLVPTKGLARKLGLPMKPIPIQHGGLRLTLLTGRIQ